MDLTQVPVGTPGPVRELLKRCLDRDVKHRLQWIGEARILLEKVGQVPDLPEPAQAEAQVGNLRHSKLPWITAAVAVLGLAAAAALAVVHFREQPPALVKFEFPPPEKGTFFQGTGPPAMSPDGRRVVFRASVDGKNMLWVRDLDSLTARVLPGTENPQGPFWAPDSHQVGFFTSGRLMKIDVTGGPATTIAANIPGFRRGAWSQDNVIVFSSYAGSGLLRVSAAGGIPALVTEFDKSRNETTHGYPNFLPDGRHFLYEAISSEVEKTAIFVGDLQSTDKKLVVQAASNVQYVEPGYIMFARERTLMAQPFDAGKLQTTSDAVPVAEQVDNITAFAYAYFGVSRNGVLVYSSGNAGAALQIGKPVDIQTPGCRPTGRW